MKSPYLPLLAVFAAACAATLPHLAQAQDRGTRPSAGSASTPPGGMLRTLAHGTYQCALPGDAAGKPYVIVPAEEFSIGTASSYTNQDGTGTYILRGTNLTFTRGPKKGEQFRQIGDNTLQQIRADGSLGKLICTRLGSAG